MATDYVKPDPFGFISFVIIVRQKKGWKHMGKFAELAPKSIGRLQTVDIETVTYNRDSAWMLESVDELFTMLVTSFVEDTFYEPQSKQLARLQELTRAATQENPEAVAKMAAWARREGNMRSAPIVVACEYAFVNPPAPAPSARSVIDSVCLRADEPAEILGYWFAVHGRKIPSRVNRGVADAVTRLYTQRSALRYDGNYQSIRMGDVIRLVGPKPIDEYQNQLFTYLIDKSKNRTDPRFVSTDGKVLDTIANERELQRLAPSKRRDVPTDALQKAGFSWERYSGWIPGDMDGKAWDTVIPLMGYMALLRNLRNFEESGISPKSVDYVRKYLSDPHQIERSRQLPFRFWSAYKHTHGSMFAYEIEQALDHVFRNAPRLDGETLVFVDVSGSMTHTPMSAKSKIVPAELAAVFGSAINASSNATIVAFASYSTIVDIRNKSVLRGIETLQHVNDASQLGHSTNLWNAVTNHLVQYKYDRVIVLTDMQFDPGIGDSIVGGTSLYIWDLSGYGRVPIQTGQNRFMLTGISDKAFGMIQQIEGRNNGRYPWDQ